jgi:hypothetical protein
VRRRSTNLVLAAILVAIAIGGGVVARALPSRSGAGGPGGAAAEEPYTSRWLCPVVPQLKGELTIANTGTKDALLRATMRWDGSTDGVVDPPRTSEPPDPGGTGSDEATETTGSSDEETTTTTGSTTTTTTAPPTTEAPTAKPGTRQVPTGQPLKAGEARTIAYGQAEKVPSLLEVESFGAPVAVNGTGQPACVPGAATRWWLPTADVAQGGDTRVVVANPGEEGATARVTLHTAGIRYEPSGLKQLFVPGRSARLISVKRWLGASAEQSVQVQALFGTVVVGALTTDSSKDKSPAIVPAQWGNHDSWAFAGGLSGEAGQTTLLLTNPGDGPMGFDVEVISDKQSIPLPDADELEVPAGTMQTIPITVDVDGPIGVLVRSRTGDAFGAGLRVTTNGGDTYVDAGGGADDERWVLPQPGDPPIAVANYGDDPIRFSISDLAGGQAGEGGELAPNRVAVIAELPKLESGLVISADHPGLVVRTASDLQAIPGDWIGGLPVNGQVRPGPADG